MSGAAFEGLEGVVPTEDSGAYEPGVAGFGRELVEEVAESYLSGKLGAVFRSHILQDEGYRHCARVIGTLIGGIDAEAFDPNLFIDEVLDTVAAEPDRRALGELLHLDWLLTPLVQALYDRGFNDFDVTMPESLIPFEPLSRLKGTETRPLRVDYTASKKRKCQAMFLGYKAEYCRITASLSAENVGNEARSSVFEADCNALYGSEARSCEFHIHSRRYTLSEFAEGCTFYAHVVSKKPNLRSRLDDRFYWRGNTFLYPDKGGNWQRVKRK